MKVAAKSAQQSTFITQILYPMDKLTVMKTHAFLIGWNLEQFKCVISCIVALPSDQYHCLETALSSSCKSYQNVLAACSNESKAYPIILGEWIPEVPLNFLPDISRQSESVWMVLTKSSSNDMLPTLHSIYSLGCLYKTSCYMCQYNPIDTDNLQCLNSSYSQLDFDANHHKQQATSYSANPFMNISEVELVIAQINISNQLSQSIAHYLTLQGSILREPETFYHSQSQSSFRSRTIASCTRIVQRIVTYQNDRYRKLLLLLSCLFCRIIGFIQHLLSLRYGGFHVSHSFAHWLGLRGVGSIDKPDIRKGMCLRDISLTAAFLSDRISLCIDCVPKCAAFTQLWYLPARCKQTVWMNLNSFIFSLRVDITLGCIIGTIVYINAENIVSFLWQEVYRIQYSFIVESLEWFKHSPGGIKLNSLITNKMGLILELIVQSFVRILCWSRSFHVTIIKFLACIGSFGFTVQLVFAMDVVRLLTLHIAVLHRLLSVFHQLQIRLLYSLWLLFRGKKKNTLRKRVDTGQFDSDQFLMGILLFAIVLFFFPSFAVYFYLFALAQLCVVASQCAALVFTIVIKDFPFYSLAVHFFYCKMLCNGVQVQLLTPPSSSTSSHIQSERLVKEVTSPRSKGSHEKRALKSSGGRFESSIETWKGTMKMAPRAPYKNSADIGGVVKGILKRSSASHSVNNSIKVFNSYGDEAETASLLPKSPQRPEKHVHHKVRFFPAEDESTHVPSVVDTEDSSSSDSSKENDSHSEDGSSLQMSVHNLNEDETSSYVSNENNRERAPGAAADLEETLWKKSSNSSSLSLRYMKDSSALLAAQIATGDTVHFALEARPLWYSQLFSSYLTYIAFVCSEDGLLYRLLNGVIFGRPALDIQLIHAISSVAKQQAFNERHILEWAFSSVWSPAPEIASVEDDRGMESIRSHGGIYSKNVIEHGKVKLDSIFNLSFWEKIQMATVDEGEDSRPLTGHDISSHGSIITAQVKNSSRKVLSRVLLNRVLLTFACNLIVLFVAVYAFSVYCLPASVKAYVTLGFALAPTNDGLRNGSIIGSHIIPWTDSIHIGNESTHTEPSNRVLHLYFT